MCFKKYIVKFLAKQNTKKIQAVCNNAIGDQRRVFKYLTSVLGQTEYGKKYNIVGQVSIYDFQKKIPISDYEKMSPFIERAANGEKNILWKGLPKYFAKTSGTTSGVKYIPLSKEMLKIQIRATQEALLLYANQSKNYSIINGKMMFLQGSPSVKNYKQIPCGRLSGIVANYVPSFLQKNRLPSMKTNSIEDWGLKVKNIISETRNQDLRLIGGIPPWVIMYFEQLLDMCGKKNVKDVFPNLSLYVYGGANFEPYKNTFKRLAGEIDFLELYPASEGFIGYQNDYTKPDMLLLTNHGIFYEFVETSEFLNKKEKVKRCWLKDVRLNTDYVIILNTCAGLWGYNIGDTIRFTSTNPYKIIITGRIQHFISAFGEHVINHEVETALAAAVQKHDSEIIGFTVCPETSPKEGLPGHDWFIEFGKEPIDFNGFITDLDLGLRRQNIYYNDLVKGGVIRPLKIIKLKRGGINNYMESVGKLGGQNKCPQISNDRTIGDYLNNFAL